MRKLFIKLTFKDKLILLYWYVFRWKLIKKMKGWMTKGLHSVYAFEKVYYEDKYKLKK